MTARLTRADRARRSGRCQRTRIDLLQASQHLDRLVRFVGADQALRRGHLRHDTPHRRRGVAISGFVAARDTQQGCGLCGAPWRQPRNPSWDVGPEVLVSGPKLELTSAEFQGLRARLCLAFRDMSALARLRRRKS